jgi:oligoendopeptidase F
VERSEIPAKYRWNLGDLYPSDAAWAAARDAFPARIAGLAPHRGHLGDSPQALLAGLDAMSGLSLDLSRLAVYASARADEDTRVARTLEMRQSAEQLGVQLSAAASWVRPEILSLDPARVRDFLAREPRLAPYRFYLEDVLRWKPHTLSSGEELVVAEAGNLADAGATTYGVLIDADLPFPTVKLSSGEQVRLDSSAYEKYRSSRVREDRDRVFEGFFGALKGFSRTMGTTLNAQTRSHVFEKNVRRFDSSLQAALFRDAIPTAVYTQLLADVRRNLPTLHRYLALRKRMMAVPTLRYQDLYVPLVDKVDLTFDPEEARAITLEAFAPLGKEYVEGLRKGYQAGWTDYLASTGKKSGAYSTGVYGVHPYQLLNFNGSYEALSTLAHESGHSMHTALAYATQPYPTADYATFVAEVASTLNEALLFDHMMARAKEDPTRLALLGNYLDRLRLTLFRQAQFADFELAFHQKAERGEPLTGDNLGELYLKLLREYYGHDKGVVQVDDLMGSEWAFIPHFYGDFYVYQYATSSVASTALAKGIRDEARTGSTARRDAYLRMLRAGGSRYPIDLLKEAGVDMTTSAPFDAAMAEMNAIMDQMEAILARSPKAPVR